ncbi:hypothetical protein J6590_042629 [Homalodisca vitripennis]|nr:hypothetical protein J6590_042629 [Homalodisca vitripennis]
MSSKVNNYTFQVISTQASKEPVNRGAGTADSFVQCDHILRLANHVGWTGHINHQVGFTFVVKGSPDTLHGLQKFPDTH